MFTKLKMTDGGLALLAQLPLNTQIEFTKIELGSGNAPSSIPAMTQLTQVEQTIAVTRLTKNDNNTIVIGGNLMGTSVTTGFYWKEVGIKAKVAGSSTEVLIAYDNAGAEASYIPAGGAVIEQLIDFLIQITNENQGNIIVDSSLMFITQDVFEQVINDIVDNEIPKKASTSQAQAGTDDTNYMSAKNVSEQIVAKSITTSGNYVLIVSATQPTPQAGKTIIWINTAS